MRKNGKHDYLQLLKDGEPNYLDIMKIFNFKKDHVACATDMPITQVKFGKMASPKLKKYFRQWAELINLVAEFFEGNEEKTKLWFKLSNPSLGYIRPRNMILMGRYKKLLKFVTNALDENNP